MKSVFILLLTGLSLISFGQDFPKKSDRLVNDYAKALTKSEVTNLENLLVKYDNETSVQIAVVIMSTIDGYPIDDYAFQLGEKWGIGQSGKDNGALILVSIDERKMWIATGYGLEATLPDAMAKRIIENEIKPQFKGRRYYQGLKAGADAMILATKGEYQGQGNGGGGGGQSGARNNIPFIFLIGGIWLLVMVVKSFQVNRHARLNGLGFMAAWMLLNSASRRHGGSYSNFSGGSGGFGGGGGFGGFGGGSFGGGGAGGSW
ncbi:MAG: hypothetical protein ACI9FU_000010 [Granulosicoccus sp.]|jgi:uncharacterized protein